MTPPLSDPPQASPWLAAWLRPRDAIERVLATNPRRHVVLLAVLGGVSSVAAQPIISRYTSIVSDWRLALAIALFGAVMGLLGLYVHAFVLTWIARAFGGRAPAERMRAVVAWGMTPTAVGLSLCVVALFALNLANLVGESIVITALAIASAVLGVWTIVCTLLMYARVQAFGFWRAIASAGVAWLLVLAVPLAFRTFLFQPFDIPSGAMMPTLLIGDHIFVSKYAYGYTRYSLPFSPPLFSGRILASEPRRGDVVVFRLPKDDTVDYVKRVVGLPGDRIQMIKGVLTINGAPIARQQVEDFVSKEDGREVRGKQWRQTLPDGVTYTALDLVESGFYDNTQVYAVPPGHYFMLGDNLDNSTDSRVLSQVGYVPFENIVGRAVVIYFSVDRESGDPQPRVRFERFGMTVR